MATHKDPGIQPYVSPHESPKEFTPTALIVGLLLAVVFGAANAYLGLKVGMTVSASIPAAVISMAIIRGFLRRDSILENNMVQTIGSAGESLAAGIIFTVPALFLWHFDPGLTRIALIGLTGGLIGVLMMVPLRRFLIIQEHHRLPYPEGTACAEVLLAGEKGGVSAKTVFVGLGVGMFYKFLTGIKLIHSEVDQALPIPQYEKAVVGGDLIPALLGVGYIIGARISAYLLSGAVLGWLVLIPAIHYLGQYVPEAIYPATEPLGQLDHWSIWNYYIRYIGAGAVAFGGIISLIKALPIIINAFQTALGGIKQGFAQSDSLRTDSDMPMIWVIIGTGLIIALIAIAPVFPIGFWGAAMVALFGFFFVTVSSELVGIVGGSSLPVSGMTIATLLFSTIIFKMTGLTGMECMVASLSVGAIICVAASIAGDTSQDLKTGFLVGATPHRQQVGEVIGVIVSALTIGWVLHLLHSTYGFGSKELAAPQATLMKLVVEGIVNGNLPWALVFIGVFIGLVVELLGIPVLPFAVGLYLPIHLSTPIMIGGLVKWVLHRKNNQDDAEETEDLTEKGILYSSGLIAGEGLMGVLIALIAWMQNEQWLGAFNLEFADGWIAHLGAIVGLEAEVAAKLFSVFAFTILTFSLWRIAKSSLNSTET